MKPYGGWRTVLTEKLTDIADAIREKTSIIPQISQEFVNQSVNQIRVNDSFTSSFVKLTLQKPTFINCSDTDELRVGYGTSGAIRLATYIVENIDNYNWPQIIIAPYDKVGYYFVINSKSNGKYRCSVIAEPCEEDGSAIVKYTPEQMAQEIRDLTPGPSEEELILTGECQNKFSYNNWNWFIEKYGDKIKTKDITIVDGMFCNCNNLHEIPFKINCSQITSFKDMYNGCVYLTKIPELSLSTLSSDVNFEYMFNRCCMMREVPEWLNDILEYNFFNNRGNHFGYFARIFSNCYSLRNIPEQIMKYIGQKDPQKAHYYTSYYQSWHSSLTCLDELNNVYCEPSELTSETMSSLFSSLSRVKNITFATDENGAPYIRKWKNQQIDLHRDIGLSYSKTYILNYNSGITTDKEVVDDETYQALKNDPDWFTQKIEYSRYNHDSAVRTINSLPDTSEYLATTGGTNAIKFKGESGSKTDGGAINTLTEEEIAVATAKGWTVSFI